MKRLKMIIVLCALLLSIGVSAAEKSQTIVYVNGAKYYIHNVQSGETIYSLSKLYGVSEQVIIKNNPSLRDGLKADQNIKIPFESKTAQTQVTEKKLKKRYDIHIVERGETLYAISRKYSISVAVIIEDNPNIDPSHIDVGDRILIRKSEQGESSAAQNISELEQYKDNLNSVADDGYSYHLVHAGETLYALSRRFDISEQEIIRINNLTDGLKTGTIIKLPSPKSAINEEQISEIDTVAMPHSFEDSGIEASFRAIRESERLQVSLLLPLSAVNTSSRNIYVEFYEGFLLGLEDVKNGGRSVDVTLFDTARDYNRTAEIVSTPEFRSSHLIVGPVYENMLLPVLQFAEENSVPVVSPLANIENMGSDVLFQMSPDPARKHDKLANLFGEGKHITLIYTDKTDKEFEQEILSLLGTRPYSTHKYEYLHHSLQSKLEEDQTDPSDMTPLLENGQNNVFVVMSDNETEVDRILAAIASANYGLVSRGNRPPKFVVLGNPRWLRYNNIDRALFFKNRVVMVSTYHAKRDSMAIRTFDSRFVEAFGTLPSLYAYRGYDAAIIFCNGMFSDIEYNMEGRRYQPLQTIYNFQRSEGRNTHINQEWMRVNYNSDHTITIE